jgi:hypothetical protein
MGQDPFASDRGDDHPAVPLQQRDAERVFQFTDLNRERRLADATSLGRAAEMAMLDDRKEVAQITDVHRIVLIRAIVFVYWFDYVS